MIKIDNEKALEYIDKILPPKPMIVLEPKSEDEIEITVFDSKMGGVPYFPKDQEYPKGKSGSYEGRPLRLLAQLNFERLPHIEDFPKKGILQFFCSDDEVESVYGLDFDDPVSQNGFRVVYHENIITDESKLLSEEDISGLLPPDSDFPFYEEHLLEPKQPENCRATYGCHMFDKVLTEYAKEALKEELNGAYDAQGLLDDVCYSFYDDADDERSNEKNCIGGYPFFTQEDPRGYNEKISEHDVLLFQSASNDFVMWGDCGVANFFIKRNDLINLDFSNVAYNWDCC